MSEVIDGRMYKLLVCTGLGVKGVANALEAEVNKSMAEGWTPYGSPVVTVAAAGGYAMIQAVVKYGTVAVNAPAFDVRELAGDVDVTRVKNSITPE